MDFSDLEMAAVPLACRQSEHPEDHAVQSWTSRYRQVPLTSPDTNRCSADIARTGFDARWRVESQPTVFVVGDPKAVHLPLSAVPIAAPVPGVAREVLAGHFKAEDSGQQPHAPQLAAGGRCGDAVFRASRTASSFVATPEDQKELPAMWRC